jgi:hypothetical protein
VDGVFDSMDRPVSQIVRARLMIELREIVSVLWLIAKIVLLLLLMDPGVSTFVYQNF